MIKNISNRIKTGKYISILSALLLFMTFLTGLRYYINQNIFKSFNLGNLGTFGTKLEVSVIVLIFMGLGCILGFGLYYLTRKRIKQRTCVTLYSVSGLFAIIILLIQPYNLQLMLPGVNQQNIAMINCIAIIVFGAVETLLLSWSLNVHILRLSQNITSIDLIYLVCIVVIATLTALLCVGYGISFAICVAVYASVLLGVNILHSFVVDKDAIKQACKINNITWIVHGCLYALVAVLLLCSYFIVEPMIAIG